MEGDPADKPEEPDVRARHLATPADIDSRPGAPTGSTTSSPTRGSVGTDRLHVVEDRIKVEARLDGALTEAVEAAIIFRSGRGADLRRRKARRARPLLLAGSSPRAG